MNQNLPVLSEQGNQFEIFNYQNLGSVRTARTETGDPLFCLVDVCNILGIKNSSRVMERLFTPGVHTMNLGVQTGVKADGTPAIRFDDVTFIDQGNLFKIIFTSRKPEAQNFANWVYNTVLPSLMNKGYYAMKEVSPATMFMEMSKQMLEYERKFSSIDNTLIVYGQDINYNKQDINDNRNMIDEVQRIQRQLIETGYISIKSFMVYHNIDMNTIDPAHLGRVCSNTCNSQGIPMGNEPSDKWNFVNTYPYQVVFESFQQIAFNKTN